MTAFNAELYLRLCAEESLLNGEHHHPHHDPLMERARVLIAVGAITPELVGKILGEYAAAADLRGLHWSHRRLRAIPTATSSRPVPRIAGCHQTIDTSWGTVALRYASFQNGGVRLAVKVTLPASAAHSQRPGPHRHMHHQGPQTLTIGDDTGASASAGFSGGGSDEVWTGRFEVGSGISPTTRWLEVEGVRVDLDEAPDARVAIEQLDTSDPAHSYLQRHLERMGGRRMVDGSLNIVTETLIAAGAVPADSPELEEAQKVADSLQSARHGQPATGAGLSEPWHSILSRRRRGRGRVGSVFIGSITPPFDEVRAVIGALESSNDEFEVDIGLVSAGGGEDPEIWQAEGPITYRAVDDNGNHYLGGLNGWSSDSNGLEGTIQFQPALDPKATRLDMILSGQTERAVVGVDLLWDDTP